VNLESQSVLSASFSPNPMSTPTGRIRSPCCERPGCRAAEQRDECAAFHSITSIWSFDAKNPSKMSPSNVSGNTKPP
jgi:hypothetical protein